MDTIALVIGYFAVGLLSIILAVYAFDISFGNPAYRFLFFGFGPVWFSRVEYPMLYSNMIKCGYSLKTCGGWAFGFSVPKWAMSVFKR